MQPVALIQVTDYQNENLVFLLCHEVLACLWSILLVFSYSYTCKCISHGLN